MGCELSRERIDKVIDFQHDTGKMAFSFFRRKDGESARLVFNSERLGGGLNEHYLELTRKMLSGEAAPDELAEIKAFRQDWAQRIMDAPFNGAFDVKQAGPLPKKARILASLKCDACGEMTMESRTRRLGGRTLCGPCFDKEEGRI